MEKNSGARQIAQTPVLGRVNCYACWRLVLAIAGGGVTVSKKDCNGKLFNRKREFLILSIFFMCEKGSSAKKFLSKFSSLDKR